MRAVILAAGFGRRMMPLTANTHKSLIKIAGRAVLSHIMDALVANDVTDVTICSGYRASELEAFMAEMYPNCNVDWVENERYETTNNIYSLALALDHVADDDIILIESDLIFDQSIITKLIAAPGDAIAMVSRYEAGMDGTVVSLSNDVVTAIHPPHLQGDEFNFSNKYKTLNIYKFSAKFVGESLRKLTSFYAKSVNDNCYYELVLGVMIYMQSSQIHGLVVDTSLWTEIDDPIDMQVAEFKFNPSIRLNTLDTTHGAYWNYHIEDFCYIQNSYFPSDGMVSMLRHHLPDLIKSFGSCQTSIDNKLSYLLECDASKVVVLNGSSQIYPWLRQRLDSKTILIPSPTFGEYSRVFQDAATYQDQIGFDPNEIEKGLSVADVIVFVNPNNPTGSALPTEYIEKLIANHPDKLFIVDESFIDFSNQPSIARMLKANPKATNVILIKSLGKSLGVPGLRLGYVFSNDELMLSQLRSELPIWNINSIAEYFLELLLKNRKHLEESYSLVKRDRERFRESLLRIPLFEKVYCSEANFVLVKLKTHLAPAGGLSRRLLEDFNIYIKDVSSKFSGGELYYRFAVKKFDSNELLLSALEHLSKMAPAASERRK